jgi:hypothetical protein
MNLFAPRTWTTSDISLLKGGSILFGIAVGLSLPKRCKAYAPLLLLGVAALAARPILHYFRHEDEDMPWTVDEDRTPAGENL